MGAPRTYKYKWMVSSDIGDADFDFLADSMSNILRLCHEDGIKTEVCPEKSSFFRWYPSEEENFDALRVIPLFPPEKVITFKDAKLDVGFPVFSFPNRNANVLQAHHFTGIESSNIAVKAFLLVAKAVLGNKMDLTKTGGVEHWKDALPLAEQASGLDLSSIHPKLSLLIRKDNDKGDLWSDLNSL